MVWGVQMYILDRIFFVEFSNWLSNWCIIHGTSWPPLELRQHILFLGIRDQLTFYKSYQRYCWWKKSCINWYGQSISHYLHGFVHPRWLAGFLPPTLDPANPQDRSVLKRSIHQRDANVKCQVGSCCVKMCSNPLLLTLVLGVFLTV